MAAFPAVDLRKSARPMAEAVRRAAGADPIYLYDMPEGTVGAYTFYLARTIPNVAKAEEVSRALAGGRRAIFMLQEKSMTALARAVGAPLEVIAREKVGHRWMLAAAVRRAPVPSTRSQALPPGRASGASAQTGEGGEAR
jgi:hypothetical protein